MEYRIKLVTKIKKYAISTNTIDVKNTITNSELNQLICQELGVEQSFDFAINNEILRPSLDEFLNSRSLRVEGDIEIEYFEKFKQPEDCSQLVNDDWISKVQTHKKWILAGSFNNSIYIWTLSGEKLIKIDGHTDPVKAVVWIDSNEDSATFASGSLDNYLRIWKWNTITNEAQCMVICRDHMRSVDALDVSPNRKFLLSSGYDKLIKIWSTEFSNDIGDKTVKRKPLHTMESHTDAVTSIRWSNNNNLACSSSMDHTIKFWDIERHGVSSSCVGRVAVFDVDLSPFNNDLVVAGCADKMVRVYDRKCKDSSLLKARYQSHRNWVFSVRWSKKNENLFVSGAYDNEVKVWDIRSMDTPLYDLCGHTKRCFTVDWTDPNFIVSGAADSLINVYQTKNF